MYLFLLKQYFIIRILPINEFIQMKIIITTYLIFVDPPFQRVSNGRGHLDL